VQGGDFLGIGEDMGPRAEPHIQETAASGIEGIERWGKNLTEGRRKSDLYEPQLIP
jgi:hypothetical protein